jgi:hypothetical protein
LFALIVVPRAFVPFAREVPYDVAPHVSWACEALNLQILLLVCCPLPNELFELVIV